MQDFHRHPALRRTALTTSSAVTATFGVYFLDRGDDLKIASFVNALIPIEAWAWVWMAAATFLLTGIASRPLSRWSMSIAASLWTVWGASFLWEWASADGGYLIAIALLGFGAFMWILAALFEVEPHNGELPDVDPPAVG